MIDMRLDADYASDVINFELICIVSFHDGITDISVGTAIKVCGEHLKYKRIQIRVLVHSSGVKILSKLRDVIISISD